MIIQILIGDEARNWLADARGRDGWLRLYQNCAWATSMQSLPFVESWYDSYREKYEPVLVFAETKNELTGLLTLALEKGTNRLVVAGDQMCEYGAWLAADADTADQFIESALDTLEKKFPNVATLQFLYLAAETPLGWLDENRRWHNRCELKPETRPLLRFEDDAELQASLKKKSNRSRLNQMKKLGAVELEQVTDIAHFEEIFDAIKSFVDLRLSAVHRVKPTTDAAGKNFYLALFKANLLFVTLLKIGEEVASAHFDLQNGTSFLLGMTALSPFFTQYSPSKFHITLLCLELLKRNIHEYDLTPGGNYKDRHANDGDRVHVLTVYFSRRAYLRQAAKKRAATIAGKIIRLTKIKRETLDKRIYETRHKMQFLTAGKVFSKLAAKIGGERRKVDEMRIYAFDADKISEIPNPNAMNRNRIEDLLKYEPTESFHLTASDFHRLATERLSEGASVYTKVEEGKLVHCGWLLGRQEKSFVSEVNKYYTLPPDSAVLFDFFTHPQARGKGFYQAALRQMLHEAAAVPNTRRIYIAVAADNGASRHVIEKVGFDYQDSLYARTESL